MAAHINNPDESRSKVAVFCNTKGGVAHYASQLERKLNELSNDSDCIVIHGGLNKHEKFWRICFFCGTDEEYVEKVLFCILSSTNASNVGIDNDLINLIIRFGLPRDLMTFFQERGRGARQSGSSATCVLYTTVQSYVSIMSQILNHNKLTDTAEPTNEELELRGAGSSITPLSAKAQRQLTKRKDSKDKAKRSTKPKKTAGKYDLSHHMRRQLRERSLSEINNVVCFFFLNKGCQHYRAAFYMSDGCLDRNVDACREVTCHGCPVCTHTWEKFHFPVFRSEVVRFFELATGRTAFPHPVDVFPEILHFSPPLLSFCCIFEA